MSKKTCDDDWLERLLRSETLSYSKEVGAEIDRLMPRVRPRPGARLAMMRAVGRGLEERRKTLPRLIDTENHGVIIERGCPEGGCNYT